MAVSEGTIGQLQDRRGLRIVRRALLFVIALVAGAALVIGLAAGGLALLHERELGRVLPGISVAGVDVGGLTLDEARATLATRLAGLSQGGVSIRTSLGNTTIAFADVGRGADVDAMVTAAAAIGRGGTWLDESIASLRLKLEPASVALQLTYDHDRTVAAVTAFADRMALKPVDSLVVGGRSTFIVIPGIDGHRVDVDSAVAAVDAAMRDPSSPAGTQLAVGLERVAPGLSSEAATDAKRAALRMARDLKVATSHHTWTIKAWQIRSWITFGWEHGVYGPVIERSKVPAALKPVSKAVARPVLDAEFLRDKHGRIVGSKADRAGRALDVQRTTDAILATLAARNTTPDAKPTVMKVTLKTIAPKVTTAQAAKRAPLMVRLGSWTTYYQVSAHNGFGANITVPARVLNGTVVQPGAVFDFWGALGEVSLRTGYKMGGAIIGGHSVEGKALAGGICAASTTLFNAALRSGYDILARQPHWYYITRYPLGLDATVSNTQTMRFRNDTPYPLLIRSFTAPGVVTFEIWSVPNGRTVSLSKPAVSNVVAGSDSQVNAPDLPVGTNERTEWPVDGKDVVVTRTVRDVNGRVIHADTFVSRYHRMIGILRVGTGPAAS